MTKTMSGPRCNGSFREVRPLRVRASGFGLRTSEERATTEVRSPKPEALTFLVPWPETGEWAFRYLPEGFVGKIIGGPTGGGAPYLREFAHLARRRGELAGADVVFAWELRTALALAVLRRRGVGATSRFVVVGPILKNPIRRALPLISRLLADADHIACFSRAEREAYPALLKIPASRFSFVPTPWRHDETISERDDGYILALGDSARDYDTLRRAVQGTALPLRIIDRHNRVPGAEANELVARATLHVVPLRAGTDYSAGQTALLRAMAVGKSVIVSDTPGVHDYVVDSKTAVCVPPGDANALQTALKRLWDDATERRRLGKYAAQSVRKEFGFPRFAARIAALAGEISPHGASEQRENSC